jgi:hypothetical protein
MTDPTIDVEAVDPHDPGPVPEVEDDEAGALAALEQSHYAAAFGDPHPIAEVAE